MPPRRVVSCVGAFGSNEYMEKVCGDATVEMVHAAKAAKVPNFVFISAHDYQLPFVLSGYVLGKKCAPIPPLASSATRHQPSSLTAALTHAPSRSTIPSPARRIFSAAFSSPCNSPHGAHCLDKAACL